MEFEAGKGSVNILAAYISLLTVAVAALIGLLAGWLYTPLLWLLLPLLSVASFLLLYYPRRFAATMRGRFDGTAVRMVSGVWLRKETFVPISALRTYECWTPPLHRLWHCRTVVLRFAGGAAVLPLLSEEQADRLTRQFEADPSEVRE